MQESGNTRVEHLATMAVVTFHTIFMSPQFRFLLLTLHALRPESLNNCATSGVHRALMRNVIASKWLSPVREQGKEARSVRYVVVLENSQASKL